MSSAEPESGTLKLSEDTAASQPPGYNTKNHQLRRTAKQGYFGIRVIRSERASKHLTASLRGSP